MYMCEISAGKVGSGVILFEFPLEFLVLKCAVGRHRFRDKEANNNESPQESPDAKHYMDS